MINCCLVLFLVHVDCLLYTRPVWIPFFLASSPRLDLVIEFRPEARYAVGPTRTCGPNEARKPW